MTTDSESCKIEYVRVVVVREDRISIETSESDARHPTKAEIDLKIILRRSMQTHIGAITDAVGVYPT